MDRLLVASLLLSFVSAVSCRQVLSGGDRPHRPIRQLSNLDFSNFTSRCPSCAGTCNEELGRCDCVRGYSGPDCRTAPEDLRTLCNSLGFREPQGVNCTSEPAETPCINACNARGTCMAGFCMCHKGFFGSDCSLSLGSDGRPELLAGTGYELRARRPHIYVYELPPRYVTWPNILASDRPLTFMLHQRLLGAGARVADGDSADWFLVPINMRGPGDSTKAAKAIKYIRRTWPWWNRTHGARHVLVHVGDPGRADVTGFAKRLTENCTYLHHFGLYEDFKFSSWKAAHRPGKDVVVPIYIGAHSGRGRIFSHSPLHPASPEQRQAGGPSAKSLEMLFAGRICGGSEEPQPMLGKDSCPRGINKGYSQGVRQAVHRHHWNRSGFSISTKNPNYQADLRASRFCLAPTGGGHGHRQILVAFAGCVPLLIGDTVLQPFEPELNWSSFSISVPQVDIPVLHERLAAIDNETYTRLQHALTCAAQHLTYTTYIGSFMTESGKYDAFETTLQILRAHLDHPDVAPEQLADADPQLAAFMACADDALPEAPTAGSASAKGHIVPVASVAAEADSAGSGGHTQSTLCSLSAFDEGSVSEACRRCTAKTKHMSAVPGGMPCCGAESLAHCVRMWN